MAEGVDQSAGEQFGTGTAPTGSWGPAPQDDLDARASRIDTRTRIGEREALGIILRAAAYIRFFGWRYAAKFAMKLGAYIIGLGLLPWPTKMLTDHVVLGKPIEEATDYPPYWQPVIELCQGWSSLEILALLLGIGGGLVLLIGRYVTGYNDDVEAGLAQGHDYATQVENKIHGGHSTFGGLWGYVEFKIEARLTQALNHTLRAQLFSRIGALSMTQLEDQRIGDSIYRVLYDAPQINEVFYEITHTPFMSTFLYGQAMLTAIATYSYSDMPEMFWMTAALFPTWFGLSLLFTRIVRRRGQAARAAGALTTGTIEEGMDNVLAVQSLGSNATERDRFDADSKESFRRHRAVSLMWMIIPEVVGTLIAFIQTAFFVLLIHLIIDDRLSPGDFAAMFVFWGYLMGPARSMGYLWIRFQDNVAGLRRVFAMMDLPAETDLGRVELPPVREGVSMRGAGLVYPDGRRALEGVDLDARIGQIVAFVGPTGAGKTSLAYLIPRYHVATEGAVSIDGHNVNDVTLESLRGQVTYVFQETQLFSDSIFENIRYGKPGAGREDVMRVARTAGIHDFIMSLPEGYDTKLGSASASKLSVGQKQRISIARGLLRDSRILILDEPTSALDPETEEYLVQSLHEAAKDRLVFIIAHRLSTIAHADKIVFLEDGRVMEQGSHDELMALQDGRYRRFVALQTAAADDEAAV
ncbi:MAG: ABC transporter ATP-binding protein [Gammaproteobacteria bacterium]|nr:ABC transporter ATP-binding protein [Gammaproteobacteria bacterium]